MERWREEGKNDARTDEGEKYAPRSRKGTIPVKERRTSSNWIGFST